MVGKLPVDWNEAVSTNPIAAQYEVHMRMQMHSPMHMRAQCVRTTRATATVSLSARTAVIGRPSCQSAPRREFGSRPCLSPPLKPALPSQPHPSPCLPSRSCRPRFWRSSSSPWPWPRACAPRSSSRAIALPVRRPTYDGPPYDGPPNDGPPNDGPPNDGLTYYGPTQLWPHLPTASLAAYGHAHHGYY